MKYSKLEASPSHRPAVPELPRPRPFRPASWLPGPHLQTLGGRILRGRRRENIRTERIELPDGDFVDLDEAMIPVGDDAPIGIVLHGLEGSSRANYVVSMARELARVGIRALRLNFRGCSGEMNRLPRFYHAGDTDDVDHIVRLLRERFPDAPLGMIGFSLGGNVLLKYLAERGESAQDDLSAAAAISVPFDLVAGTRRMEAGGMSRFYTEYFLRKLRRKLRGKRALLAPHCDVDSALRARTLREFDDIATARLHGFEDAWHYYESSSSHQALPDIRVPTLVLHSLDDAFLPTESVPVDAIESNPWLVNGLTRKGGHVGFVSGTPWRHFFWAEREAANFLAQLLSPVPA